MMSEQLLLTMVQELQGLSGQIDKMDKRFGQVEQRLDKMDERFDQVEQRLDKMDTRLEVIETDVKQVNASLSQMELSQPSDIHSMLHTLSHKIDSLTKDIEYTYHKTAKNELEINRLRNQ